MSQSLRHPASPATRHTRVMDSETPGRIHFAALDPAAGGEDTIMSGYAEGGIVHLDRAVVGAPFTAHFTDPQSSPIGAEITVTIAPERLAEFARACNAAASTLRDGLTPAMTALGASMRAAAEGMHAAVRQSVAHLELEAARHWPAPERAVCAHVCGPDAGHACDARASTSLRFELPSGGVRDLPLCGPCAGAENAATSVAS